MAWMVRVLQWHLGIQCLLFGVPFLRLSLVQAPPPGPPMSDSSTRIGAEVDQDLDHDVPHAEQRS